MSKICPNYVREFSGKVGIHYKSLSLEESPEISDFGNV